MPRTTPAANLATLAATLATALASTVVGTLFAAFEPAAAQPATGQAVAGEPAAGPSLSVPPTTGPAAWTVSGALGEVQLDQLTAPIALYPDALLAQILIAATYPAQIVEADRWRSDPANAALSGAALLTALRAQPWDLSIKSLVPFSQVLQMMDANLQWTERIGEAFDTQQGALMDSIQRLRQRAAMTGALTSTRQQNISTLDQSILIDPATADEVYVPEYDPDAVYGTWPWPDDPPCDLGNDAAAPGSSAALIAFDSPVPVPVLIAFWGWQRWHWRRHVLGVALPGQPGQERSWRYRQPGRYGPPSRYGRISTRAGPRPPTITSPQQADGLPSRPYARRIPTFGKAPAERVPEHPTAHAPRAPALSPQPLR